MASLASALSEHRCASGNTVDHRVSEPLVVPK
eukprot:CAMPEP_0201645354 /NCGR_PEP_ID=MMETSP0493-20130528/31963_1 /ASSEMBLY_ACC=CAM_ASM_000838 /TAXON_ID=420259 /ORGANISM="Thalassiosira gravida, Strain GMp14c1" /LENGTH=31 /DNA_ID= /DNA_START= /DNA_END= /DNA_ORIENTATION=